MARKVGRNDPCPCGSGKKYKHCHWRIDREAERRQRELYLASERLVERLQDFVQQEHLAHEGIAAWELWWDNKVPMPLAKNVDPVERARFFDWFVLNFRTSRDRKRPAELFLDAFADELPDLERELLRQWVQTYLSVYEITEPRPQELEFTDIFTGEARTVRDAAELGIEAADYLMFGRLLPLGEDFRLAPGATAIPESEREALLEYITPRYEAWKQARYGADWHDFLREAGYQIQHFLIRDLEPLEVPEPQISDMDPVEAARAVARRMQSQLIVGPLDLHYERWLDEPIPEWNNRTPREMAQSPEGRRYLEPLLELLEEIEAERAQSGQPAFDITLLRQRLGLLEERRTESGILVP